MATAYLVVIQDPAVTLLHRSHQEHVGRVAIELEPVSYVLPQHQGCKWTEVFPIFYLQIEHRGPLSVLMLIIGGKRGAERATSIARAG